MKAVFFLFSAILLQVPTDLSSVGAITEKLTTMAILSIAVYVLYKRDVAKDKKNDDLMGKIMEINNRNIEVVEKNTEALKNVSDSVEKFISK